VFADPAFVTHSEGPADEKYAGEDYLSRKFFPPGADVLGVADEEGPFAMILDVKVVVNAVKNA
jgi:hypothetical protein